MESLQGDEAVEAGAGAPVLDAVVALAHVGGDRRLLRDLVELFLQDESRMYAELEAAVRGGRAGDVSRCAHALKGTVAVLGSIRARDLAHELEACGRDDSVDAAGLRLPSLRGELDRLAEELRALVGSAGP